MLIVDSQVHIWGANTPGRPWPSRAHAQRDTPVTADEVLGWMNEASVDRAILVPPSWEGDRNDLALEAARHHPDRFAVMGRLDPESPRAREMLEHWRGQTGMLGLRFTFHTPVLLKPLLEGRFDWVWGEAERLGLPVMLLIHHPHMHLIDAIAQRHPALKLVIDHLGLVNGEHDAHAFRDMDLLLPLARRPNVAVKSSALPCYSAEPYPYRELHPYIRRVYDAFGPRRMFWGTDQTRSPVPYARGIALFTQELDWLSSADLEWIMGRGVCEWIGWALPKEKKA
jgi:predicted TIM-barrel fold metal-dependent hydrolase